MNEVIKVCRFHGALSKVEVMVCKEGNKNYNRCKKCRAESSARQHLKNKERNVKRAVEWKNKNRDHYNALVRLDRKSNPEKYREYEKRNRDKDRVKVNETEIARRRGITRQEYQERKNAQNNLCAICSKPESRIMKGKVMSLTLDHCHETNRVREFLCNQCNLCIGAVNDDISILEKAIEYLRKHQ